MSVTKPLAAGVAVVVLAAGAASAHSDEHEPQSVDLVACDLAPLHLTSVVTPLVRLNDPHHEHAHLPHPPERHVDWTALSATTAVTGGGRVDATVRPATIQVTTQIGVPTVRVEPPRAA